MRRFLLVPSVLKGNGSGHIVRSFALARELVAGGDYAALYVPDVTSVDVTAWKPAEIALAYPAEAREVPVVSAIDRLFDLIVLDRRSMSDQEASAWRQFGPTLALDEGGDARAQVSYLVDILPRPRSRVAKDGPNRTAPGFLSLPQRRRDPPEHLRRVLVTFGGEDRLGLARYAASYLVRRRHFKPEALTVVSGALSRPKSTDVAYGFSALNAAPEDPALAGVTFLGPVQDLKEHLASYDLVLTQFGLTALEAAWAGCAVLLLSPSRYHRALARTAGFAECGVRRFRPSALAKALAEPGALVARTQAAAPLRREDLADFVRSLEPAGMGACPVCGSPKRRALERFERKSYFRCVSCGMVYMEYWKPRGNSYVSSYFFEDYARQYGKTYLEDFPKLTAMAASRLDVIERLSGTPGQRRASPLRGGSGPGRLSVLDVGCAYGAFVAEASRRGWEAFGLDVADEAVDYVRKELHLPAVAADFSDTKIGAVLPHDLDCLAMWYVIEHFERVGEVLKTVSSLLRPGGVFAFSTPSCSGISGRSSRRSFYERSPDDHWTVWTPSRVGAILRRFGLRLKAIRVTGHHPERFPGVRNEPGRPRYAAAAALSRACGLGDTFECYAVKM